MTMKKSTIWILGVVMGLSFLSLLYLQISYIEEMVKMRNGQFDESVKRALMANVAVGRPVFVGGSVRRRIRSFFGEIVAEIAVVGIG